MSDKYCDFKFLRNTSAYFYINLIICVFGSIANVINICVLRSKQMQSSTNCILTGLALSDLLVMLQYIPFTVHRYYKNMNRIKPDLHFSHAWAVFYKFHALFTIVCHFISCCLTIILAIWRYIYISKIHANNIFSNHRKTKLIVMLTYLLCPLICFPLYSTLFIRDIKQRVDMEGFMVENNQLQQYGPNYSFHNVTIYMLFPNDPHRLSIWIYSLCLKFLPCILLSILSYFIISKLLDTKRRKRKLLGSCNPMDDLQCKHRQNSIHLYKESQADRTTIMLLMVLLLFLITEFPQAILGQLINIYGDDFYENCYAPLGKYF